MNAPEARQQMLFRVPADAAYAAFADPAVTTRFWFTHSDGPLVPGVERRWEWRMYGVETRVRVLDAVPNERLLIEWGDDPARSRVEWTFQARPDGTTLVTIRNYDLQGDDEQRIAEALDSTGGFSLMLANAKAFLEHGLALNLIADRAPDALIAS